MRDQTKADLDWLIRNPQRYRGTPKFRPAGHKLKITGRQGKNAREFNVRCACMAECQPSGPYYNYDLLAVVRNIDEAITAFRQHLEDSEE